SRRPPSLKRAHRPSKKTGTAARETMESSRMRVRKRASARTTETIPEAPGGIRLQKYLAAGGIASRRESERLIESGRVEVNGVTASVLGIRVDPRIDVVRVDGRRVRAEERRVTYLLSKPKGFIT